MTDLLYTDVEESLRDSVRSTLQRSLDEGLPARLADEPDTDVGGMCDAGEVSVVELASALNPETVPEPLRLLVERLR